jgi:cell division protein ZapE
MDLQARYAAALAQKGFVADPAQERAVAALDRAGRELCGRRLSRTVGARLRRRVLGRRRRELPVRGVYLWGGVGCGKTFVMDLFFEALPFPDRLRYHLARAPGVRTPRRRRRASRSYLAAPHVP